MNVCLLTSANLRHAYIAHRLKERFNLSLIIQERKRLSAYYGKEEQRGLVQEHFAHLDEVERRFFGNYAWESVDVPTHSIAWGTLNTEETRDGLPNTDLTPSPSSAAESLRRHPGDPSARKHIQYPPRSIPLPQRRRNQFLAFRHRRLQYIGVTLHLIDPGIDTGPIIGHARPDIEPDDTQHNLGLQNPNQIR